MWRIRPSDLVQIGIPLRVGLGGANQATTILIVDRHLRRQQESGTQPRRLRAELEHGGHAASVPDTPGRDHGHRGHRVHDGGHQGKRRDAAPYVASGLPALCHDDISTAADGPPRLFGTADRLQKERVGIVDLVDVVTWIPPHQRHDPKAGVESLFEATVLIGGDDQIAAERSVGR